ncbi:putative FAD-dependent oxidoreductase [Frankia canadensis]|uniref:Putative FAD-dependent oxidoreductase n=1 Tax=Frankia canadensis TaxID=1836972 RepID=A0A2I2KQG1_9ACTN|nr:FAD-dependent monooxygenase [Frankia canadensis]SNQ47904.1 putative FAD-dependent oxidoreductase [Frankia canadensis]SOU55194.1 putative FAD-dependent oxidoreductase [Frankia canadensis]
MALTPERGGEQAGPPPRIVIVGGGLAGLTLARILHETGIAATVYELDARPGALPPPDRVPVHPLDLRPDAGLRALRAARITLPADGIDAAELRRRLLDGLPSGRVVWDTPVMAVRRREGGRGHHAEPGLGLRPGRELELELDGGASVPADLVVGADGTWSRIRRALDDARPRYTGMFVFDAHLSDVERRHPALDAFVGGGVSALTEDRGLVARRVGDGVAVQVTLRLPAGWTELAPVSRLTASVVRDRLARHFTGWDDRLGALIRHSDAGPVARAVYALPRGPRWPHRPGITLIGDAAHPGAPFADAGANQAMLDAADLAQALTDHPRDLAAAQRHYETTRFARAGSPQAPARPEAASSPSSCASEATHARHLHGV